MAQIIDHVKMVWSASTEFCTNESCPVMCAGQRYEYLWPSQAAPKKVTAPEYAQLVTTWATETMKSPGLNPIRAGETFSPNFKSELSQILKRLFRVYAHMYLHHFRTFITAGAAEHLNFCFKFFLYAVDEFQLLSEKDMEPLKVIIAILRKHRDGASGDGANELADGVGQQQELNQE